MCPIDRYRILSYEIGLRYPSQAVADVFRHFLGGFSIPNPSPVHSPAFYDILEDSEGGAYRAIRDGAPLGTYRSLSHLVSQVESAILSAAFEAMPYLGLHAGVAAHGEKTLLLPGFSGAGKTSLVLGLLLKGWTLLSDEAAPVRPDTSEIIPFLRVLCVKNRSLDLFRGLDRDGLLDRPDTVLRVSGTLCIAARRFTGAPPDRSFAVDTIVFPTYVEGSEPVLNEISRARGLSLLMQHAFNRNAFSGQSLHILGRLVERAACFELRSSALNDALNLVLGACNRTPP